MELLKVTRDIAIRAILWGACKVPKIGMLASSFDQGDLVWAEKMFSPKELKAFKQPLWTFSGSGYGSGYGDGSGYGSGYGSGDGYGYGYGDGDGDGYGYGDGNGYGYGYGYGSGDGDGYGYGYGYGDGDGYGYGDGNGYGYGSDITSKILALKADA